MLRMISTDKTIYELNSLHYWAEEYLRQATEERDILNVDRTKLFLRELEEQIKRGELINVQINGIVRKGKSTLAFKIGMFIVELLNKYTKVGKVLTFGMTNIARDQQEFSRKMTNPDLGFTVIVVDEINELEKGGENATTEFQLQKVFSDVQAGRYVHKVSISPKDDTDPNAEIILEVIAPDFRTATTHCRIYYKLIRQGIEYKQLVGHVNIYVGDIIKNWNQIKDVYFKREKTEVELKLIDDWMRKDWYIEYVVKKYEKMELITKYGIFRPRLLEYAGCILRVVEKLAKITKIHNAVSADIIHNFVKKEYRQEKLPQSIIGEELATREANGILNLHKSLYKLAKQQYDIQANDKIEKEIRDIQLAEIGGMMMEIKEAIDTQTEELRRYETIFKRYQNTFS
jgi:hypothetical protein